MVDRGSLGATLRTAVNETSLKGEFKRSEAAWRNWVKKDGKFPPEANRCKFQLSPTQDGWGRGEAVGPPCHQAKPIVLIHLSHIVVSRKY
jgi:hypothetical protein